MPFFGYRWQGLLNRHGSFRDDRLEVERAAAAPPIVDARRRALERVLKTLVDLVCAPGVVDVVERYANPHGVRFGAVRGLLRRMLRGEDQKLKTWQLRCGVPPRAAACAEKQNAPAIYRRGRARQNFFEKFLT